jgi:hypothetical protein
LWKMAAPDRIPFWWCWDLNSRASDLLSRHSVAFCSSYFWDRVLLFFAQADLNHYPPILDFPLAVAGMTEVLHCTQLLVETGSHKFLPGLASNHDLNQSQFPKHLGLQAWAWLLIELLPVCMYGLMNVTEDWGASGSMPV